MKTILPFLSILITSQFFSIADATAYTTDATILKKSIVKTLSGTCSKGSLVSKGSGLIFKHDGKAYVITSNHVIQSSLPAKCHEVSNSELGKVKATHLATDWGMGLSLLELTTQIKDAPELSSFQQKPTEQEGVITTGFPFELDTPVIHEGGKILSTTSRRHFFPNTESLIEVTGSHGEFGMSGGPVFNAANGDVTGLLSHQALVLEEGKPTRVLTIEKKGEIKNHLLIIPAKMIKTWVLKLIATGGSSYIPTFDNNGSNSVTTNGLKFEIEKIETASGIGGKGDPVGIGGKGDPVGIGGAKDPVGIGGKGDPVGIGGRNGDPVGIGGTNDDSDEGSSLVITVKKVKGDSKATSQELLTRPWWSDLSKQLLQKNKAIIRCMIRKEKSKEGATTYQILKVANLEQVFHRLIESEDIVPLIMDSNDKNTSAKEKRIIDQALQLLTLAEKLKQTDGLSDLAKNHLLKIELALKILATSKWMIVGRSEVNELIEGENVKDAWDELFASSFQKSVDLMAALRKLLETI